MRSVSSSLRESKKRENKLERRLKFEQAEKQKIENRMKLERRQHKMREQKLEQELMQTKRLLAKAERRLEKFRTESDWKEPENEDLNRADDRAFRQAFRDADRKLDLKKQLEYDPTGALATFWAEQRRRLHVDKQAKWNPQVSSCMRSLTTTISPPSHSHTPHTCTDTHACVH